MTSVLADDDTNPRIMKPKSGNRKISIDGTNVIVRDETRSFLDFPRENLNMSHSELEQGFNKRGRCIRVNGHSLLSVTAIVVALVCAGIEIWKLHRVLSNSRDIEILKKDVETLRLRTFGKDFMDELKAFEEQLYADETDNVDEDSGETDIDGADYDNYYEDYGTNWSIDDATESTPGTNDTLRGSPSRTKVTEPESASLVRHETKNDREIVENSRETRENIVREHLVDEGSDLDPDDDHRKQRRALADGTPVKYDANGVPHSRDNDVVIDFADGVSKNTATGHQTTEAASRDRHPPKKYFANPGSDNSHSLRRSRHSSKRHASSPNQRNQFRMFHQDSEVPKRSLQPREITQRHLRAPRQVFAAHYGADSALFGMEDDHTGNGRAKHNEGVFKAWRPSDWVADLGMIKHFTLTRDGRLTVHEPGLYLIYGQIHYLDEHDENGFHILVNSRPIMQCMVYSPGVGHKSRSCFSAQITILQAGDHLILKDVGPARYTLFQHDKSFFGLVKLGDSRQQQQQKQHSTETPKMLR